MKTLIKTLLLTGALVTSSAFAQVTVENAWVRAMVPQQQGTGAFLDITSDKDAKLVGVSSTLLPNVEIHEMAMENNVMKMRQVAGVDLPAGKTVQLKPGGYHLMFMGVKQQLKDGDTVPLTLTIENNDGTKETIDVQAPVRPLNGAKHSMDHMPSQGHHGNAQMKH